MSVQSIIASATRHSEEVITPNIKQWNKAAKWPRDASDKAAKDGLLGLYCPKKWGGQELSLGDGIQVYEKLGAADGAYAFALSMHNICSYAICNFAPEVFKKKWAADLILGKKLANFALTEPQSGSDATNMQTIALKQPDGSYKISGKKAWVSLADEADVYLVVAKTNRKPGYKDMAMFAIAKDSPGLTFGPIYQTISYKFLPISEMHLDKVIVSEKDIILPIGMGLKGALTAIDIARVSIASGCCGLIKTALDTALRYCRDRKMFGKTSLELDGINWSLVDVATDLEIAQLLYKKAANALGTDEGSLLAAKAKLFAPNAALRAVNICTQAMGGSGLLNDYGMGRLTALAQMLKIVDGTTEIQRVVIARHLQKYAQSLPAIKIPH